ncbi:LacI family DNA-binding transcriptional regulator [Variovorax sp. J22P240]|uniref:LacI family DNA-binding transcriptional regulator n=1 Tax=unclassified Variovorax TaxID=663243 RepID=UPI002576E1D4|nr:MULTISPECIES: LacI family DNA-binding transcriptional regulator [unclassified Variovorax]MDM0002287.1 LacI family DNA-binding transcriptional regulator [Variovorax sp. J22P240]MDM0047780.1 LacI family DNA-binding transcriptional regulator [Variovorax sp. J22R115]
MNAVSPFKAATLHDVAKAAGVSLITASRALSNPGVVSKKTIEKVQAAVESTGYIPNLLAGGLKSKRSLMVGGIVPALSVAQFLPTVQALTTELASAGYQLILGQTSYDAGQEESVLNTMIGRQPDGIVMTGLVQSQKARDRLRRSGIPVVETWDLSDRPVDMLVGFSHVKVGGAVGGYFLSKGWKHIGIATGDDHRARMRRDGFQTTLGREVPTAVVPAPSSLALGRRALAELLEKEPRLEAVCCSSDQLAQGVMVEALARGLRVPQDLAICGFGNADFGAHTVPSISTVHVDGAEIGRLAARLIVARCRGESVAQPVVDVGFRMIERQSSAT